SAAPTPQQPPAAKDAQTPAAQSRQAPAKKPAQASATKTQKPLTLDTQKDKESYAIGMSFGSSLHKQSVEVDTNILIKGLKDSLAGGKTLLTEEESRAIISQLQAGIRKKQEEKMAQAGEGNLKEGQDFLAAN